MTKTKREMKARYIIAWKHTKIETPTMEVGLEARFLRYHDDLCLRVDFEMMVDQQMEAIKALDIDHYFQS